MSDPQNTIAPGPGPDALIRALQASGRQFAVTCGAAVALLSLLNDTPVRVASLRGAMAWGAVLLVVRGGVWFTERAWVDPPAPEAEGDDEAEGDAVVEA